MEHLNIYQQIDGFSIKMLQTKCEFSKFVLLWAGGDISNYVLHHLIFCKRLAVIKTCLKGNSHGVVLRGPQSAPDTFVRTIEQQKEDKYRNKKTTTKRDVHRTRPP